MKKRLFVSMIFSAMVWSMTACGSKTVNVEETHEVIPTEAVEQEMETQEAAITDRNTSFETSFGEVYTAVSEGFEAGETDVETILGIEKIQQDEVDEEVEEGNEEATAAPENVRPELVEFFEAYDEFADDYCTFLEKYYGASDNSDMDSENEEMTKKNDNFNIEIRSWMDVDMTSEESDYYYNECMRIREKIAAGMEKAIELRDSK